MTLLVSTVSVSPTEKSHAIFSGQHIDSGFSVDNTLRVNQCGQFSEQEHVPVNETGKHVHILNSYEHVITNTNITLDIVLE